MDLFNYRPTAGASRVVDPNAFVQQLQQDVAARQQQSDSHLNDLVQMLLRNNPQNQQNPLHQVLARYGVTRG